MPETQTADDGECRDHCCYRIGIKGDNILCYRCGRIRAIKETEWKVLY